MKDPRQTLLDNIEKAIDNDKQLDVTDIKPEGTYTRLRDKITARSGRKSIAGREDVPVDFPIISQNYESFKLAMDILGPEWSHYADVFKRVYGEGDPKKKTSSGAISNLLNRYKTPAAVAFRPVGVATPSTRRAISPIRRSSRQDTSSRASSRQDTSGRQDAAKSPVRSYATRASPSRRSASSRQNESSRASSEQNTSSGQDTSSRVSSRQNAKSPVRSYATRVSPPSPVRSGMRAPNVSSTPKKVVINNQVPLGVRSNIKRQVTGWPSTQDATTVDSRSTYIDPDLMNTIRSNKSPTRRSYGTRQSPTRLTDRSYRRSPMTRPDSSEETRDTRTEDRFNSQRQSAESLVDTSPTEVRSYGQRQSPVRRTSYSTRQTEAPPVRSYGQRQSPRSPLRSYARQSPVGRTTEDRPDIPETIDEPVRDDVGQVSRPGSPHGRRANGLRDDTIDEDYQNDDMGRDTQPDRFRMPTRDMRERLRELNETRLDDEMKKIAPKTILVTRPSPNLAKERIAPTGRHVFFGGIPPTTTTDN